MKDWPARIPLIEEIPTFSLPIQIFERFKDEANSFFLESVYTQNLLTQPLHGFNWNKFHLGRYSFIGKDPFLIFKSKGKRVTVKNSSRVEIIKGNPPSATSSADV